ncbi:hypothetical protein [Bryobacter aggregatus]|uniref:hypothetical protein n=1 Tax=Bryobacter aggregatus TaxID=360054 RepID=UPI0004E211A9|nr:hypothetical protein [Bryobacter aggregatus]
MSFSLLLIGLSLALFAYWFRYTCILILRTQTAEDFASEVGRANGLSFHLVRNQLESNATLNVDALYRSLESDYRVVTQLLDQAPGGSFEDNILQNKLLRANFRVTQAWFRVSRCLGLRASVNALEEMADTVNHFANSFGEFSAVSSRA